MDKILLMMEAQHKINYNEKVISIKDLYKSFGDLHVLKGISLDLHKGENIAVLGKSGTGKSVLIKIISGLLKPEKGEGIVLGKNSDQLTLKVLNKLSLHIHRSNRSLPRKMHRLKQWKPLLRNSFHCRLIFSRVVSVG